MRNNPQQCHLVATAGNENTLKLWSLERPASPIFTAKNVCKNMWQFAVNVQMFYVVILLFCFKFSLDL